MDERGVVESMSIHILLVKGFSLKDGWQIFALQLMMHTHARAIRSCNQASL